MLLRSLASRLAYAVAIAALVAVVVSLALRLTFRDRFPAFAPVFYATPLALDCAAALFATVISWRTGHRRVAILAVALTLASGGLCATTSFVLNEPHAPGALRGVLWNLEYGAHGWTSLAETLKRFDPDVAFLAESGEDDPAADVAIRAAFPGRAFVRAKGGLAVVARGQATLVERTTLLHSSRMALFHVAIDGRAFDAVQVDAASNPLVRRPPIFDHVRRYVEPRLSSPLLVLGDFNTPRDSSAFDSWRGKLVHAFETTGRGLDATWPVPLPVLSIDHVWAGGGLVVRTCELPWTCKSDHLPVVFTFDLP